MSLSIFTSRLRVAEEPQHRKLQLSEILISRSAVLEIVQVPHTLFDPLLVKNLSGKSPEEVIRMTLYKVVRLELKSYCSKHELESEADLVGVKFHICYHEGQLPRFRCDVLGKDKE